MFLEGVIVSENVRFRDYSLTFRVSENDNENAMYVADETDKSVYTYPSLKKTLGPFSLEVEGG